MSSDTTSSRALARAENIALLYLLHRVPEPPSKNPRLDCETPLGQHTLTLGDERRICSTLAFLAYPKDDPNRVAAVCLQEDINAECINIILSINKRTQTGEHGTLLLLKKNFEMIFAILANPSGKKRYEADNDVQYFLLIVAQEDSANVEAQVFQFIVDMCSLRILTRLNLRPRARADKRIRPPINESLLKVTKFIKASHGESDRTQYARSQFLARAKDVIKLTDEWRNHQTPCRLESLVDSVYHLESVRDVHSLIESIPNAVVNPTGRKSLSNIIAKVARYRAAAKYLCSITKTIFQARKLRVVLAELPPGSFAKTTVPDVYDFDMLKNMNQVQNSGMNETRLKFVCNKLGVQQDTATRTLADQTRETLKSGKIHAEIQLLYFLELQRSSRHSARRRVLSPRVICSNKDACWLCNQFILMHGKMHVPKSHGRIYPGWTLPALNIPLCADLERRFNIRLQQRIRQSLDSLSKGSQPTRHLDPNESTLLTLRGSYSTLNLPVRDDANQGQACDSGTRECPTLIAYNEADGSLLKKSRSSSRAMLEIESPSSTREAEAKSDPGVAVSVHAERVPGDSESTIISNARDKTTAKLSQTGLITPDAKPVTPRTPASDNNVIHRDKTTSMVLQKGQISRWHMLGQLNIQVQYDDSSKNLATRSETNSRKLLSYTMEHLTHDELVQASNQIEPSIINLESLTGEIDMKTDSGGCLYLSVNEIVYRLRMLSTEQGLEMDHNLDSF
ncbi:hypothetical protein F5Y18DRAFT_422473 [Xylariaceae sp. FL1019]|nr:hypothetical protein F5Y18DRAFT_422473 [Xylariaceae sp. FL1019]